MNYLEPSEVAKQLSVSRATLQRLMVTGEIECVVIRAGKRKKLYRIAENALDKWLAENRLEASKSLKSD